MVNHPWRILAWVATLLATLLMPLYAVMAENLLDSVGIKAKSYATDLASNQTANYTQLERSHLYQVANLLLQHNRCGTALDLAKQSIAGLAKVPLANWLLIGKAAQCSSNWGDAVAASWLGTQGTKTLDAEIREESLARLGAALESHPDYGSRYAIAAYQEAVAYGVPVWERLRSLEQTLAQARKLRVDRTFVQTDSSQPAICFDFSVGMPSPTNKKYGDYIRFDPPFSPRFRIAAYDEVCADGATFGTDYTASILPGLVGNEGDPTTDTISYEIEVGDKAATVWFENNRYVLPIGGGVPIHSVNATKTKLTLYRVVDRNLLYPDVRDMLRTDISDWQAERIRDELGEQVWEGDADIAQIDNQEVVTNLTLADQAPQTPGIYVLTAIPEPAGEDVYTKSTMWLVISDIGITSYQGADGLTLITRSLKTGKPLGKVRINLYARNNTPLGESVSDADGVARLPIQTLKGTAGQEPMTIMASGPGVDFNFLDLSVAPYDFSDRGVMGRESPGPVDAFLYTERGVYRPGESVQLAALLRTDQGQAIANDLPLTLRLLRPDAQIASERVVKNQGAGGYSTIFALSSGARTGNWMVQAFLDPKAKAVGTASFQVEDIVPPRIEVNITKTPPVPMLPGVVGELWIQARYLFGAPGAELAATGELRIEADPKPFPNFADYRFGPVDELNDSTLKSLDATQTDAAGNAIFAIAITELPKLKQPLQATLRAEVADVDGRTVATSYTLPVRQQPLYIGIKVPGDNGQVPEGTSAKFQIITVNATGQPVPLSDLTYRLIEEQSDYQWYREDNRWVYKYQVRDQPLREGKLTVATVAPAIVDLPSTSGKYRLEVQDPASGAIASARVESGWAAGSKEADTPDKLIVRTDRKDYRPGEVAKLTLQAPFIGPASLVLASNGVLLVKSIELTGREQVVDVPVETKWSAGVYALITAYRPDQGTEGHGPRRAVGLAWLGIAQDLHQIPVNIAVPELIRPRQRTEVRVQVKQPTPGQATYVTLAAVDEGVLRLTDYQNPNPLEYYFGQRTLGLGLRDIYGKLIDGHQGTPGQIRSGGGDESGRRGAPDPHIRVVSLFSGIVKLDGNGLGIVPFDVPDFNGKLRLVAVAWDVDRVGQTTAPLTVRDPVVVLPSVPRFLAAGDQSMASILIHNMDGSPGDYRLKWATSGVIALSTEVPETVINLPVGGKSTFTVPLLANGIGNGTLKLHLTNPKGEVLEREVQIGVRAPFLPERHSTFGKLIPRAKASLGRDLVAELRPETITGLLTISTTPALDVPGLLRQLDLYPYGCLEQVTSRAFPLLYIKRLGTRWGYRSKVPVSQRLTEAVANLLEKQQDNGGFSLWSSYGDVEPWLSAHAMDFLQQARANGVEVPDFMWNRGLEWLRRQVVTPNVADKQVMAVQAYAVYLLARNGETPAETARYLLDQGKDKLPSILAAAQLGTAFAIMGDIERTTTAFAIANSAIQHDDNLHDYGSKLRDLAGLVLLMTEAKQDSLDVQVQQLAELMHDNSWLSTQEQAWIVRAANVITDPPAPLVVQVEDLIMPDRQTPFVSKVPTNTLVEGLDLINLGKTAAWYSLAVDGSPISPPLPMSQGLEIQRRMLDLDGEEVDPTDLPQGSLIVVMLEGKTTTPNITHQILLIDPLPAGLEIENSNLANAVGAGNIEWIGRLSGVSYSESLDDRFVAAMDLNSTTPNFRLAYLARAVTPGRYRAPPPLMEDMYRPHYRARGNSSWLHVIPAK